MTQHDLRKFKETRELRAIADSCDSFVHGFISSYLKTIENNNLLTVNDIFVSGSSRLSEFPMIDKLFRDMLKMSSPIAQRAWFRKKGIDLASETFVENAKLYPLPKSSIPLWQAAVDRYIYHGPKELVRTGSTDPRNYFKVLDVAKKKGSGTGSVGLSRFWVLIEGESKDPLDDRVLEFKQATDSVR